MAGTLPAYGLVAGALDNNTVTVDLTDSGLDLSAVSMTEDDVAVISVPAYTFRVPPVGLNTISNTLIEAPSPYARQRVKLFSHSDRVYGA